MESVSNICSQLLPILGVIVLVLLIVVFIKLIGVLSTTDKTIAKTHGSIEIVEETLNKVQTPVDTAVKVAKSVDSAYDASAKALSDAKEYVSKNMDTIKGKVSDIVEKATSKVTSDKPKEELTELSSEDILAKENN